MKIPVETESLSSPEMINALEQKYTMSEKSDDILNEGKFSADTNIIPIKKLNRPSSIKEYRCEEFERFGRLSWNQVRQ